MKGIYIEGRGKEEEGAGSDIHRMMEWISVGIDIEGRGKEEIHRMMKWIMEGIDIEGRGKEEEGTGRERRGEEEIYI